MGIQGPGGRWGKLCEIRGQALLVVVMALWGWREMPNIAGGSLFFDAPLTVLRKFELLRESSITFGCFLLFCKAPSIMATIDAGRFDSEVVIKDSRT